jgi:hypothetical protein
VDAIDTNKGFFYSVSHRFHLSLILTLAPGRLSGVNLARVGRKEPEKGAIGMESNLDRDSTEIFTLLLNPGRSSNAPSGSPPYDFVQHISYFAVLLSTVEIIC